MNLRKTLTLALLGIGLSFGTQTMMMSQASAKPFETLTKSRKSGKRTHKKSDSSSKKKSDSSSSKSSSGTRQVTRTTTRPSTTNTSRTRTNVRPATTRTTRTTTTRRPSTSTSTHRHGSSTSTRTVRNVRPRTTSTRTTRTTSTRRGATSRRSYYRSGSTRYRSSHSHSHSTYTNANNRRGATVRDTSRSSAVEGYVTGGLGISGFAANEITDLPLPGAGYNVALGAKGKFVGAELGINGGGYTFDPGSASADIAMVGLSGDLKLQPSFGFFEPYIAGGVGGYALKDAVINEGATGLGLRAGIGADFRFQSVALRVNYQHGWYGLNDVNDQYDGKLAASTETLGANLVVYF